MAHSWVRSGDEVSSESARLRPRAREEPLRLLLTHEWAITMPANYLEMAEDMLRY